MQNMTDEAMQDYLTRKGVNDILKHIVTELCTHKPDRPVQFMQELLVKYREIEDKAHATAGDCQMEDIPDHMLHKKRRGAISSEPANVVKSTELTTRVLSPKGEEANARIDSALRSNSLCSHLDESDRREIYEVMVPKSFKANEKIIVQGDPYGDEFYVVEEGECDIYINRGSEVDRVQHVGVGGSFGELALIYNTPRAATVVATTDVKVWSINRMTYRKVLMDSTMRKRQIYENFLDRVPILSNLHKYEKLTVADALEPANFEADDVIVKQGEAGDVFYLIIEGKAQVTQIDAQTGASKDLGQLGPSDYFGEIALLTDRPRAATVTAVEPLKCVRLDRERFNRVLGPCEDILRRNMAAYNKYIANQF